MKKTPKQKAMELLKPPFVFQMGYIFDSAKNQNMVCDDGDCELGSLNRVRGWGRLGKLPDGEEIQDAIGEIIAEALNQYFAPNAQGAATDEKTNARGEPEAIYLQLHDPDEFDTSNVADYKAEVTWCWHKINGNDVRYIREDLALSHPLPPKE